MKKTPKSDSLFERAQRSIPGGVNSPVRAFKSVGRSPLFIARARGSKVWDVDGHEYIDYLSSWGPLILGHAHPRVLEAIRKTAENGTSFGAATERETEMAELVCRIVPSMEMVRMVNSGTEATMSALRLARAYTRREKIIKFEGCYHGHADSFLVSAGSGLATLGIPTSAGMTKATISDTLVARYNDLESVRGLVEQYAGQIAAIIAEPVVGNMGCVPPANGFLRTLQDLCRQHEIVFILDEVMTGFRVSPGGAQQLYGVTPDLTTLGKIIGGGLPVGAYGGKREIMSLVAPMGPMYQAGTLSGNPLAMAAGLETLRILQEDPSIYAELERRAELLSSGLQQIISSHHLPLTQNRVGSMFTLFFTSQQVIDYDSAQSCDTKRYATYFNGMLDRGVYLAPSQFEAAFLSTAHTDLDIKQTLDAAEETLSELFKA